MAERKIETTETREDRMVGLAFYDEVAATRLSTGQYATRSTKTPDAVVYVTTPVSCTCPGFGRHGYCKHRAMVRFLESEGGPDAPAPCWLCGDTRVFVDALDDLMPCGVCREAAFLARAAELDAAAAA